MRNIDAECIKYREQRNTTAKLIHIVDPMANPKPNHNPKPNCSP